MEVIFKREKETNLKTGYASAINRDIRNIGDSCAVPLLVIAGYGG